MTLDDKFLRLQEIIADYKSLTVAFSGGVDSSFLLKTAQDVLGNRVLAITADSVLIPREELHAAQAFCQKYGIRQKLVYIDVLGIEKVRINPPDRCYYCKRRIFERMLDAGAEEGIFILAEGSNQDDEADYRPGMRAIRELSIRSPLREAKLCKAEIRELSKRMGLNIWNKPSMACLASRVPYGDALRSDKLRAVEQAELLLHSIGLRQCRVRVHGTLARIEVPPVDYPLIMNEKKRQEIVEAFKKYGFSYVSLDLEGFRSGSMNEMLADKNSHA